MMNSTAHSPVVLSGCGWVTAFRDPGLWAAGSIAEVMTSAQRASNAAPGSGAYLAIPDDALQADRSPDLSPLTKELKRNKGAWMAALAADHACRNAALPVEQLDDDRIGLTLGCGLAGQLGMIEFASEVRQQSPRFVSPIHFPQTVGNYIAGALARNFKLRGPNLTVAAGPASSLVAIGEASSMIARGVADIVLAGGVEALSPALAEGFSPVGSDTPLAEGACFFVVERADRSQARGIRPLATVLGWSGSNDQAVDSAFVSLAGFRLDGAIIIEDWIGLCSGAAGAAASAAAIGVATGLSAPWVDQEASEAKQRSERVEQRSERVKQRSERVKQRSERVAQRSSLRIEASHNDPTTVRSLNADELRVSNGCVKATILAASDANTGSGRARLDLSIRV